MAADEIVTAAVLVIGDEILSGRTKDKNIGWIADHCTAIGIQLKEVRIVPDEEAEIVAAVNTLRARYTYVFTTGGIGPTHDDKTADAVAMAFGVGIDVHPEARAILEAHYKGPGNLNEARLRMARVPIGGSLVPNPVSKAPGFQIENVFVMAGVPSIMRGMLEGVGPRIKGGAVVRSRAVRGKGVREGDIAGPLEALEAATNGAVTFGSYPWFGPEGFGLQLVARSADDVALQKAADDLRELIRSRGAEPEDVEDQR